MTSSDIHRIIERPSVCRTYLYTQINIAHNILPASRVSTKRCSTCYQEWYLSNRSKFTLQQSFHPPTDKESHKFGEGDLDEVEHSYSRLLCKQAISPSSMANIMTEVLKEKGKEGHFLTKINTDKCGMNYVVRIWCAIFIQVYRYVRQTDRRSIIRWM